jgi:hypothetical protein
MKSETLEAIQDSITDAKEEILEAISDLVDELTGPDDDDDLDEMD